MKEITSTRNSKLHLGAARKLAAASAMGLTVMVLGSAFMGASAQFRSSYATTTGGNAQSTRPSFSRQQQQPQQSMAPGGVYPQFRSSYGTIRWLKEQMPLKVYCSPGLCLDNLLDGNGAPVTNVDNKEHWPDVVAEVLQNPQQLKSLPVCQGYSPQLGQAAVQGINAWKAFEKEGLFSYTLTNNPEDADIYVFWVEHFTDKLGMGLFQNDIRGYTAKRSFPYAAIKAGKMAAFKPVVILLRTSSDSKGTPMTPERMHASAAHEFGHALGIEGHSPNANDLMSIYYGHGAVSQGDAATIRYLYHSTPDLIP